MKAITVILAGALMSLALVCAGYYGTDKQLCTSRGYDGNVMEFPLDGKCYYDAEEGTRVYVPVEDVTRQMKRAPERRGKK